MNFTLLSPTKAQAQTALIEWYMAYGRMLPWRENTHYKSLTAWQKSLTPQDSITHIKHTEKCMQTKESNAKNASIKNTEHTELNAQNARYTYHKATNKDFSQARAYRVLVSEIMLQQTQVARVLESYYFPFLALFPNLHALSEAKLDSILRAWQGLGYYARARNLHAMAQQCATGFCGMIPENRIALQSLKGIGHYTSGAILCFGFGQSVSFVDANIARVLSRFFGVEMPSNAILVNLADDFLNKENSFFHNQALIDLGALLCTKDSPQCAICPLSPYCKGKNNYKIYGAKTTTLYKKVALTMCIFSIQKEGKTLLLCTQHKGARYKNLYGFLEWRDDVEELQKSYTNIQYLGSFKHAIMHYKLSVALYHIALPATFLLDSICGSVSAPLDTNPLEISHIQIVEAEKFLHKAQSSLTQKAFNLFTTAIYPSC